MIKRIGGSSKIFSAQDFINDNILFDRYIGDVNSNQCDIYSDEENYIICLERSSNSAWIWTKKGVNQEIINEIQEVLNLYVFIGERTKITCKKELYDIIKDSNNVVYQEDDIDVNCLVCKRLKRPKECDGLIYTTTILEIDLLYRFCIDYLKETSQENFFSLSKGYLENMIYSNGLYVWKNRYNEIVAMASYFGEKTRARLGLIYTKPEYRRNGYASNLIYELTKAILKEGLEPVVYIDNNDLSISKLFSKIGYESKGVMTSFTASKSNVKRVII